MNSELPRILLIGDHQHREFAEPVAWLARHSNLTLLGNVADGLQSGLHYHGVVFAQTRPGQITQRDVERVGRAWPLARLVALLGSWCEGETRSGDPWPGVTRVYWHQWRARCERELRFDGPPTAWQLPRTSTEAERATHALLIPPPKSAAKIAIFTHRALFFRGLADACSVAGYQVTWICRVQDALPARNAVILWDAGVAEDRDFAELQELAAAAKPARLIVLLGFPRFDDLQRARQYGAIDILALPLQLPDLWAVLQRLTTPSGVKDAASDAKCVVKE
jgi:ActR/RegA family two-component response regulator